MSDEHRVDRMEVKIDKLMDAVTELVKIQSDIRNMSLRMNNHAEEIKDLRDDVENIEKKVPIYDDRIKKGDWIWKIVAGIITAAFFSLIIAKSVGAV